MSFRNGAYASGSSSARAARYWARRSGIEAAGSHSVG